MVKRPRTFFFVSALFTCLLIAEMGCGPGQGAGIPTSPSGIADALHQARDDSARVTAVSAALKLVNIGVYTADGQQVLKGGERSRSDFYLFDFEMKSMATSLGRGDLWAITDITTLLNQSGILQPGVTVSADQLLQVLMTGTQDALATTNDRQAQGALLVWELGRRHSPSYDLSKSVSPSMPILDALQRFLVIADIVVPGIQAAGPATTSSRLSGEADGLLRVATVTERCAALGAPVKEGWGFGKWLLVFSKKIGGVVKRSAITIDLLHGVTVAFSVAVRALDEKLTTHWGVNGPGQIVTFRILVLMRDDLGEVLVKCGWLLGVQFPKKGGIPGVKVFWYEAQSTISEEGQLGCSVPCSTTTGADGIASLVFTPNTEPPPGGVGILVEHTGVIRGEAWYLSALKNVIGTVSQIITPKGDSTRWVVTHHQPTPGLSITFKMHQSTSRNTGGLKEMESLDLTFAGRGEVGGSTQIVDGKVDLHYSYVSDEPLKPNPPGGNRHCEGKAAVLGQDLAGVVSANPDGSYDLNLTTGLTPPGPFDLVVRCAVNGIPQAGDLGGPTTIILRHKGLRLGPNSWTTAQGESGLGYLPHDGDPENWFLTITPP